MPPLVLAAAVAIMLAMPLIWMTVAVTRKTGLSESQIHDVMGGGTDARRLMLEQGASVRVGRPFLRIVGTKLIGWSPVGWIESTRKRLILMGNTGHMAVERTLITKAALGALGAVTPLLAQLGSGPGRIALVVGVGAIGFVLPDLVLHSRGGARQKLIQQELPDTLDQIRMSVQAGLGFEAAMARAARTGSGPLAQELSRTLRETRLGVSRQESLQNLADRTNVDDLDSFVFAVIQSGSYGIPIVQVLRVQSDDVREKRRDRAEERALKIPILLIFPMAFCIFPVLMIVLLGPAMLKIGRELGGAL